MGGIDFFLTAAAHAESRIGHRGRLSGRRLQRAIAFIGLHLSESVRLDDVAAAAGLSTFHFARLFKKSTGLTPHRYLMNARVEKAKVLLRACDKSLTEIATECGFFDQSHMSKVFRRIAGVSPLDCRDGRKNRNQKHAFTTPPSTRSAAPLVAEDSGLQT
jgi:AraC family transcriptional regulator